VAQALEGVRPLTQAEYETLNPKRAALPQIRASHHRMAELHAAGLTAAQISDLTGRSLTHVRNFPKVPANAELIAEKVGEALAAPEPVTDPIQERIRLITQVGTLALTKLRDRLEDEGYEMSDRMLLAIAADSADRTGLGKQSTQVNLNLDLGARLQRARERQAELRQVVELGKDEFRRRA
jgi:hypothetical protein